MNSRYDSNTSVDNQNLLYIRLYMYAHTVYAITLIQYNAILNIGIRTYVRTVMSFPLSQMIQGKPYNFMFFFELGM